MKKNFWIALYTSNAKKERHSDLDTKVLTIVFKLPTTHKKTYSDICSHVELQYFEEKKYKGCTVS